mgnify:CR=1 FL=1
MAALAVALLVASCAAAPADVPTAQTTSSTTTAAAVLTDCDAGTHRGEFEGRPVRTHVPEGTRGAAPVVVVLHGADDSGAVVARQTQMDRVGEREGFITVYPTEPSGLWSLTGKGAAYLNRLAGDLACADPDRVYLAGFSRGSAMVFTVACAPGPRAYAAFGGVAFPDFRRACREALPAPIVYLQGDADDVVSYSAGYRLSTGRQAPGAQVAMRKWARHNRCRKGPERTRIGDDVLLRAWSKCRTRAAVHFYTIKGGGHQWPFRAIPDAPLLAPGQSWAAVGADEVLWEFFSTRSLPR